MAQTAFSVRMEDSLKREFSAFCENVGMNMSTAIVVFAKTVVRERQFPFLIAEKPVSEQYKRSEDVVAQARLAVERMRRRVEELNEKEPTLDEINAYISNVRAQRRHRARSAGAVHA